MTRTFQEFIDGFVEEQIQVFEDKINIVVKPKKWWVPMFIHKFLIRNLLFLERPRPVYQWQVPEHHNCRCDTMVSPFKVYSDEMLAEFDRARMQRIKEGKNE